MAQGMKHFDTRAKRLGAIWEMRKLYRRQKNVDKVIEGLSFRSSICIRFTAQQAFELVCVLGPEVLQAV